MIDVKPGADIIDFTAANRHIWKKKDDDRILFIDIEPELQIRPDIIVDNTNTDFPDGKFKVGFYDPPHSWGAKSGIYTLKNHEESKAYWKKYDRPQFVRPTPGYYGLDKYKTKQDLLNHIGKAQHEFYRVIEDRGMLWLKWCEVKIPLEQILDIFVNWEVMMKIRCEHNHHGQSTQDNMDSKTKTYWVMLMKKVGPVQSALKQTKRIGP